MAHCCDRSEPTVQDLRHGITLNTLRSAQNQTFTDHVVARLPSPGPSQCSPVSSPPRLAPPDCATSGVPVATSPAAKSKAPRKAPPAENRKPARLPLRKHLKAQMGVPTEPAGPELGEEWRYYHDKNNADEVKEEWSEYDRDLVLTRLSPSLLTIALTAHHHCSPSPSLLTITAHHRLHCSPCSTGPQARRH